MPKPPYSPITWPSRDTEKDARPLSPSATWNPTDCDGVMMEGEIRLALGAVLSMVILVWALVVLPLGSCEARVSV